MICRVICGNLRGNLTNLATFEQLMNKGLLKRAGQSFALALLLTGILYYTGVEHYQYRSVRVEYALAVTIFLRFLIFFGVLNLLAMLKDRKRKRNG